MKDHSIPVYQSRYATHIVDKYMDIETDKTGIFYENNFPSDMIFTKDDTSTSD